MMKLKQVTAALALAAAFMGVAASASAQMSEGIAAIVNDRVISSFDVRQRANLLLVSAGIQSTPEMQERARSQALRDLIDEILQKEEAARFEVVVTPDVVERRLADVARQNSMTVDQLRAQLAGVGVSISTLRGQIEADIAWQRLMGGLYNNRLRISEVEIRETQQRIAANATRPQYQLSEIFLPAENEAEFAEMTQGATRLIQEMQRGAPFPMVARQFSAAPSAAAGGDIGWIASTELMPELQAVAAQLQPGQVSMPIRTPGGIYIIAMRERRAGAAAGSTSIVGLRMITAPAARQSTLERTSRRLRSCSNLDQTVAEIGGASIVDLGTTPESDLSPVIRERINGVAVGSASPVQIADDQASTIVVCTRETGGGGVPPREEIESRLRQQELELLAERYLRNLRREATIITRQQ
jgi:peptidyl-prolyl cis-trans isomerase SurA